MATAKPTKPRPDFPLFPHASGRWAKKIKGRLHYFGKWTDDPSGEKALDKYTEERDDLYAGRKPRADVGGVTIADLCNRFLDAKRHLLDTRELAPATFAGYHRTCDRVVEHFGKRRAIADLRPEDFDDFRAVLAKGRRAHSLAGEVRRTRILFKFAYDAEMVDRPIRVGPTFKEPGKRALRKARREAGPRMFEPAELRTIIGAARQPLKSMILLAVNCGFGNTDVASLPKSAIDLQGGWIDFPRPKTEVDRRCPLWPETVEALRESLPRRPKPKDRADDRLAFLTRQGRPYVRYQPSTKRNGFTCVDSVALTFGKLLTDLNLKRPGINFYALRHTFRTAADGAKDQPAVNAIMGHDPGDMASLYRERIDDERLRAVVDHVRDWLFG